MGNYNQCYMFRMIVWGKQYTQVVSKQDKDCPADISVKNISHFCTEAEGSKESKYWTESWQVQVLA